MAKKQKKLIKELEEFYSNLVENQKKQQKALKEIAKLADELEMTSIKKKLK